MSTTRYVYPGSIPGGASTPNYTTISDAITAASSSSVDTIIVAQGTYNENVRIQKSVYLKGAGQSTIIKGVSSSPNGAYPVSIGLGSSDISGVTLENFSVKGLDTNYLLHIYASPRSGNVTLRNLKFIYNNNTARGVALDAGANNVLIDNCDFPATKNYSLSIAGVNGLTVTNSTFRSSGWGTIGIFPSNTNPNALVKNIDLSQGNTFVNDTVIDPSNSSIIQIQPSIAVPITYGLSGEVNVKLPSSFNYVYNYLGSSNVSVTNTRKIYSLQTNQNLLGASTVGIMYGKDLNTGRLFVEPGFKIASAINGAQSGNVIDIPAGTFSENVSINKSLTLKGAGSSTIIQGTDSGYSMAVRSSNVTLDSLKINQIAGGKLLSLDGRMHQITGISNVTLPNISVSAANNAWAPVDILGVVSGIDLSGVSGLAAVNLSNSITYDIASGKNVTLPASLIYAYANTAGAVIVNDRALMRTAERKAALSNISSICGRNLQNGVTLYEDASYNLVVAENNAAASSAKIIDFGVKAAIPTSGWSDKYAILFGNDIRVYDARSAVVAKAVGLNVSNPIKIMPGAVSSGVPTIANSSGVDVRALSTGQYQLVVADGSGARTQQWFVIDTGARAALGDNSGPVSKAVDPVTVAPGTQVQMGNGTTLSVSQPPPSGQTLLASAVEAVKKAIPPQESPIGSSNITETINETINRINNEIKISDTEMAYLNILLPDNTTQSNIILYIMNRDTTTNITRLEAIAVYVFSLLLINNSNNAAITSLKSALSQDSQLTQPNNSGNQLDSSILQPSAIQTDIKADTGSTSAVNSALTLKAGSAAVVVDPTGQNTYVVRPSATTPSFVNFVDATVNTAPVNLTLPAGSSQIAVSQPANGELIISFTPDNISNNNPTITIQGVGYLVNDDGIIIPTSTGNAGTQIPLTTSIVNGRISIKIPDPRKQV